MRFAGVVFALLTLSLTASAKPVTWILQGLVFGSGGTASGSFTFDADAGVPCSTGVSPCGVFSNINITTTTDGTRAGTTYSFVCGKDVPSCTGINPDSTAVLLLNTNAVNQTGSPALAFFFTAAGPLPPAGLSDLGGTIDVSNGVVGVFQEGSCLDAACSAPTAPTRIGVVGTVVGIVLPPTIPVASPLAFALMALGMAILGGFAFRKQLGVNSGSRVG